MKKKSLPKPRLLISLHAAFPMYIVRPPVLLEELQ